MNSEIKVGQTRRWINMYYRRDPFTVKDIQHNPEYCKIEYTKDREVQHFSIIDLIRNSTVTVNMDEEIEAL